MLREWKRLLGRIPKDSWYPIRPVKAAAFTAFEKKRGVKLPQSYREYCSVFGAGRLDGATTIAVPGYGRNVVFDLAAKDRVVHELYAPYVDAKLLESLLFFAGDEIRNAFGWHLEEVTRPKTNERAIYMVREDFSTARLADTFRELVRFVWLGSRRTEIGYDRPHRVHSFAAVK